MAIAAVVAAVAVGLHVAERWRAGRDIHGSATTEYVATTAPEPPPRPQLAWPDRIHANFTRVGIRLVSI